MKRLVIDLDDLRSRYNRGEHPRDIAKIYGVGGTTIYRRLHMLGLNCSERRHCDGVINIPEMVDLYTKGVSIKALARKYGVARNVINLRLRDSGIPIRNRSESMFTRMAHATPEERARLSEAAHAAVRGTRQTAKHRMKIAKTRETVIEPTRIELMCGGMLADRGFYVVFQKAIGPYNVDVALPELSIAVEIFGGMWHGYGRHASRFRERTNYLIDSGWTPVIIWVSRDYPLEQGAIEYIVALYEQVRSGKPIRGKYHMVRGDGEPVTWCDDKFNNRPRVGKHRPCDNSGSFTNSVRE
jgi:very-short-patch-repair endonuclease